MPESFIEIKTFSPLVKVCRQISDSSWLNLIALSQRFLRTCKIFLLIGVNEKFFRLTEIVSEGDLLIGSCSFQTFAGHFDCFVNVE